MKGGEEKSFEKTSELYGRAEVGVAHAAEDPIVDQLYNTTRLALFLYTAFSATGVEQHREYFFRQMDFLARIQITSEDRRLNGAWMRAFDYKNWDYYGSDGDIDWGPYCVESGWGNTWAGRTLAYYLLEEPAIW